MRILRLWRQSRRGARRAARSGDRQQRPARSRGDAQDQPCGPARLFVAQHSDVRRLGCVAELLDAIRTRFALRLAVAHDADEVPVVVIADLDVDRALAFDAHIDEFDREPQHATERWHGRPDRRVRVACDIHDALRTSARLVVQHVVHEIQQVDRLQARHSAAAFGLEFELDRVAPLHHFVRGARQPLQRHTRAVRSFAFDRRDRLLQLAEQDVLALDLREQAVAKLPRAERFAAQHFEPMRRVLRRHDEVARTARPKRTVRRHVIEALRRVPMRMRRMRWPRHRLVGRQHRGGEIGSARVGHDREHATARGPW